LDVPALAIVTANAAAAAALNHFVSFICFLLFKSFRVPSDPPFPKKRHALPLFALLQAFLLLEVDPKHRQNDYCMQKYGQSQRTLIQPTEKARHHIRKRFEEYATHLNSLCILSKIFKRKPLSGLLFLLFSDRE
jgi:hypothetical protein